MHGIRAVSYVGHETWLGPPSYCNGADPGRESKWQIKRQVRCRYSTLRGKSGLFNKLVVNRLIEAWYV